MKKAHKEKRAQTAVEYMILLGAITAVALVGFSTYLPRARDLSLEMFNKTANELLGPPAEAVGKARSYMTNEDYP